jgi:hypothetical protein
MDNPMLRIQKNIKVAWRRVITSSRIKKREITHPMKNTFLLTERVAMTFAHELLKQIMAILVIPSTLVHHNAQRIEMRAKMFASRWVRRQPRHVHGIAHGLTTSLQHGLKHVVRLVRV